MADQKDTDTTPRLKLAVTSKPVILEAADGTEKRYTLRTITGKERDAWGTFVRKKSQINEKGEALLNDLTGVMSMLLADSLHDEEGKKVPRHVIEDMPAPVVQQLFVMAKEISMMDSGKAGMIEGNE